MKKILLVLYIFILTTTSLISQNKYWVTFKDKNNSTYSIQHPESFLSEKSIDRRFRQGIQITENDLPVNNSYIVAIKNICPNILTVSKWMNAVSIDIANLQQIEKIKLLPFVKSVSSVIQLQNTKNSSNTKFEPIISMGIPTIDTSIYGSAYNQVKMIGIDKIHALGYKGEGVDIAVFDGGFLNANTLNFFDKAHQEERIIPVWNYVDNTNNVYVRSLHGMNVLSVMCANIDHVFVGAAPEANYYLFITEDTYQEQIIEEDNWVAAAEKADSIGVQIFTTSLGYTTFDDTTTDHTYADMDGNTTIITRAANIAASKGILVVNSAGNEGNRAWHYISAPADGDSVLTIGAVNENGVIAGFSSRGPNSSNHLKPNVCGQGANIVVAGTNNNEVGRSNGTSFSCPLIAAASACLWQAFPNKTSSEIFHDIEKSANLFNTPNFDYGFGIPNYYAAYNKLENELYSQNPNVSVPKAYPNPFSNTITILWNSTSNNPLEIEVFNSLGQLMTKQEVQAPAHTFSRIYINQLESMDAGTYLLRIKQNNSYFNTSMIKY